MQFPTVQGADVGEIAIPDSQGPDTAGVMTIEDREGTLFGQETAAIRWQALAQRYDGFIVKDSAVHIWPLFSPEEPRLLERNRLTPGAVQ